MSQLALDLLNKGITIVDPLEEHRVKLSALHNNKRHQEESSDKEETSDKEESDFEEEEEAELALITMPKSSKKTPTKSSSALLLDNWISALTLANRNIQPISGW